jgi:CarD family transcriptional regulator
MQYSIGDKVVHPHHGPGRITSIAHKEFLDGKKRYYVINIPVHDLTVYVPRRNADEVGIRPAVKRRKLTEVLETLQNEPHELPDDYKERQEQVEEKLRTGLVLKLAEVVRDLTWHRHRAHLTKRDTDLLEQGRERLAAEMALVMSTEISDASETIDGTLKVAFAAPEQ